MFRCSSCKQTAPAGVSPIIVVGERREVSYERYVVVDEEFGTETLCRSDDPDAELRVSTGWEIVSEHKLCPSCAGVPVPVMKPIEDRTAQIRGMQAHAAKCKSRFDECAVCQRYVKLYLSFSLRDINLATTEKPAPQFTQLLAATAFENWDRRGGDSGKRASHEFSRGLRFFGDYQQRGGKLVKQ